jgi:CheY-like chemotaxis protein
MARRILVVDDSEDDVELLRRAVAQTKVPWTIIAVLRDGEEAIRYLEQFANPKCTSLPPEVLLLDLKMPRASGFEVLAWIRTHMPEVMKTIVFSSHQTLLTWHGRESLELSDT